jgi:hypothetical protein
MARGKKRKLVVQVGALVHQLEAGASAENSKKMLVGKISQDMAKGENAPKSCQPFNLSSHAYINVLEPLYRPPHRK